ncbi:hypothetical protein DR950_17885 [Kitasatospora xanthocidica]|uniref:DUF3168 domain-containing protein n=1 Tax=Kitasatospora xanthocidica TaxID=83382 RepID=A0A372ZV95_9ACTN|nr:hypothetical protein [Kitasatospora xanthocidica]RGD59414.1 hypothetical protein DR950_17885 [Kitasatospora xanthocidica]
MPVQGRVVSTALRDAIAAATGRSCGYGAPPTTADKPSGNAIPYTVLYPLGGTTSGPPFGDQAGDGRLLYQVTSVASTGEQAEWMADKVRAAVLGTSPKGGFATSISPAGHTVVGREIDKEDGQSVANGVYSYISRYLLHVTTPDS